MLFIIIFIMQFLFSLCDIHLHYAIYFYLYCCHHCGEDGYGENEREEGEVIIIKTHQFVLQEEVRLVREKIFFSIIHHYFRHKV